MPNWKKVITSGSDATLNKLVVDGSIGHVSASLFSGSFYGDGSNLTGIEAGIFTQTGSIYATTNNLQVTGSLVMEQATNGLAIDILNANSRWRQYIDSSGHITLNASGSGTNTNVNYTLEKGNFQLNLKEGHFNLDIDSTSKDFRIRDSGNTTYFVVTGDKKVGIGEAVGITPGQDVDIAGTVRIRDYGSGTKTGTLAYTLGVDSNGDIIETTGGTDTNIANTDLTATANRTLDMGTNDLTISASQYFIDTVSGNFEVDARNGSFKVKSDTSHYVYIEGLPNGTTTNVVGYNTITGRLVYVDGTTLGKTYTAGTGISINGSNVISSTVTQTTVYTPNVFSATTKSNVTTVTTGPEFSTTDNIGGTSGASIDATNAYELHLAENAIYEITYSIKAKSNTTTNSGRNSVGFFARPFDTAGSGAADIPGSTSIMYYRNTAYGHTNTHNCTFYYDTSDLTNFEHIRLYLEEAYGDGDVNILSGTISARRIS